jgi:hypothetical protein
VPGKPESCEISASRIVNLQLAFKLVLLLAPGFSPVWDGRIATAVLTVFPPNAKPLKRLPRPFTRKLLKVKSSQTILKTRPGFPRE